MSAVSSDDRVALDVPAPAASDVAAIDGLGIDGLGPATEIGRGGLGVVYRARQSNLGREVAVKVLHGTRPDADGRERFRREAIATGRVSGHPHIVTVHSAGFTAAGDPFIVMEYVPDGSLGDTLRTRGPLTWQRASAAMVRIAGALASAHAARVLHRDVKPQNILLAKNDVAKLCDLGLAKQMGQDDKGETTGIPLGTPGVRRRHGPVDDRGPRQADRRNGRRTRSRSRTWPGPRGRARPREPWT